METCIHNATGNVFYDSLESEPSEDKMKISLFNWLHDSNRLPPYLSLLLDQENDMSLDQNQEESKSIEENDIRELSYFFIFLAVFFIGLVYLLVREGRSTGSDNGKDKEEMNEKKSDERIKFPVRLSAISNNHYTNYMEVDTFEKRVRKSAIIAERVKSEEHMLLKARPNMINMEKSERMPSKGVLEAKTMTNKSPIMCWFHPDCNR